MVIAETYCQVCGDEREVATGHILVGAELCSTLCMRVCQRACMRVEELCDIHVGVFVFLYVAHVFRPYSFSYVFIHTSIRVYISIYICRHIYICIHIYIYINIYNTKCNVGKLAPKHHVSAYYRRAQGTII